MGQQLQSPIPQADWPVIFRVREEFSNVALKKKCSDPAIPDIHDIYGLLLDICGYSYDFDALLPLEIPSYMASISAHLHGRKIGDALGQRNHTSAQTR